MRSMPAGTLPSLRLGRSLPSFDEPCVPISLPFLLAGPEGAGARLGPPSSFFPAAEQSGKQVVGLGRGRDSSSGASASRPSQGRHALTFPTRSCDTVPGIGADGHMVPCAQRPC